VSWFGKPANDSDERP